MVGKIYETAAFPDRWSETLEEIARSFGAKGGNLIRSAEGNFEIISSDAIMEVTQEWISQGWNNDNTRVSRLLDRTAHAGFLTDSDLHSAEELQTLPIYRDFLNPRSAAAGAATVISGASDDALIAALEGFASHEASRSATPALDALRPHLARATVLSSQIQAARAATLVEAFNAIGTAVALLDANGRAVEVSRHFATRSQGLIADGRDRIRLCDARRDQHLQSAFSELKRTRIGRSIAIRDGEEVGVAVLHLLPARLDARDLFNRVHSFAILASPENRTLPGADLLSALFDLTPAEARIARALAAGHTQSEIANQSSLSLETVRSQVKRVLAKTSVRRQAELVSLLIKLS